ncbi:hypothetical protein WA026_017253 [Henosepilachna vigintioctopunctata]|uniref:Uncharacterized protein n=1 Tax=Henosepilachna vigintioctopunctata TaxID=420089 RepID=A0AAW1UPG9_9CUCU
MKTTTKFSDHLHISVTLSSSHLAHKEKCSGSHLAQTKKWNIRCKHDMGRWKIRKQIPTRSDDLNENGCEDEQGGNANFLLEAGYRRERSKLLNGNGISLVGWREN